MITPEVVAFVKAQDAQGVSREATRALLMSQGGWSQENLDEAFAAVPLLYAAPNAQTPNPPQPPAPEVQVGSSAVKVVLAVVLTLVGTAGVMAAAYFFVPSIQKDIAFITASMRGQ